MADHPLPFLVVGERDGAVRAGHLVAAGAAVEEVREAAPVQEEDGLAALRVGLADLVDQRARERALLLAHVDDLDGRHGARR